MNTTDGEKPKKLLNTLFIESVKNGFIVHEDQEFDWTRRPEHAVIYERLVFNTKEQLNEYINENF